MKEEEKNSGPQVEPQVEWWCRGGDTAGGRGEMMKMKGSQRAERGVED